ncbi:MAG: hypothetical protein PHW03_05235 [Eubacteriales bacterium]|nr:hypothetical protein [Eubacteriales bacterium]
MKLYKAWWGIELHAENETDKKIINDLCSVIPEDSGVDTTGYETCSCEVVEKSEIILPGNDNNGWKNITPHSDILMVQIS